LARQATGLGRRLRAGLLTHSMAAATIRLRRENAAV
jgi:hypothetical protein